MFQRAAFPCNGKRFENANKANNEAATRRWADMELNTRLRNKAPLQKRRVIVFERTLLGRPEYEKDFLQVQKVGLE